MDHAGNSPTLPSLRSLSKPPFAKYFPIRRILLSEPSPAQPPNAVPDRASYRLCHPIASINIFVYTGIREGKRVQAVAREAGRHVHACKRFPFPRLHLNGKQSILPMHAKEIKTGTVEGIKKQLGLK
jgi:hypothetical protein